MDFQNARSAAASSGVSWLTSAEDAEADADADADAGAAALSFVSLAFGTLSSEAAIGLKSRRRDMVGFSTKRVR